MGNPETVTIATWNVNSVRSRLPRLLAWLERRRPDVVCLQETKVVDEDFPRADIESARITSYNVCYTKLLRNGKVASLVADKFAKGVNVPELKDIKLLYVV